MPMSSKDAASRCLVIAEVAQAHDGSLGTAHAYIDAAARAGADAVKFQTHIAAAESTPGEPWRVKFSLQDASRYEYWKRMEFTADQWAGLREHADQRGLKFISSPFSMEAVELLERVGVAAWKVASGECTNVPLLRRIMASGKPIFVSTGMSQLREIDGLVEQASVHNADLTVFQCTTSYPCPAEQVGLNMIPFLRQRYGCKIGLSDHSGTIFPGLAGVAIGLDALEVHITLSRECFGPDVSASITTAELSQLVEGIRFIEAMRSNPVEKDVVAAQMQPLRDAFTKSVTARIDLAEGTVLSESHLAFKKPGTGISPSRVDEIVGRRLVRPVAANTLLREEDLLPTGAGV